MTFDQFILVAAVGTVVLLGFYRRGKFAQIFARLIVVAVPLFLLDYIAIRVVFQLYDLPQHLQQATVAAVVLATGWFVTYLSTEDRASRERDQLRTDVLYALRSEAFTIVEKLDKRPIRGGADETQREIRDAGESEETGYHPFSATESPTIVFDAVSPSIAVLETETLEPVLRFYAAFSDLTAMVGDVRSSEFRKLSKDRRIALHVELTSHRVATLYWGLRAIKAMNVALGVSNPGAIPRSGENGDVTL